MGINLENDKTIAINDISADEKTYTITIKTDKDVFWDWLSVIDNMGSMVGDLLRKRRQAEAQKRWNDEYRTKVEARDKEVRQKIRNRYAEVVTSAGQREAMKLITKEFKAWWWIRDAFKKEVNAKNEFEIIRLTSLGLTSQQIADNLGLHPGTVRKIISNLKRR